MSRNCLWAILLATPLLVSFLATARGEEKSEVLCTSPSGAFRIEQIGQVFSGGEGESTGDIWVIPTKDPTQRAKLPKQSSESPLDDEFRFSPNEEWIFATRYIGSGLRYGNVYHLASPLKIDMPTKGESFNDLAWENCVKLGALKNNYSAEGVYARTSFVCWSLDSEKFRGDQLLAKVEQHEGEGVALCRTGRSIAG
jgi:hypothetical protein